jgi:uncharacterized protein YfiM (DUF2279 family)
MPLRSFAALLLVLFVGESSAQDSTSTSINKKRVRLLVTGSAIGYTGSMVGLAQVWYKNSEQQSFRFFNDNAEWKQIDKVGHFFTAFYVTSAGSRALQWAGVEKRKADLYGAITGFAVLVPIEVLDGFSEAYGASTGDLIADAAGPLMFLGQQRLWKEIRLSPKVSYHHTRYAPMRPDVLGDNFPGRALKDYNGHTLWLSVDMDKFITFPKWLNLALGYGAEGMVYARDYQNEAINLDPYRQYYLSLDFDLTSIKTRSKVVKTLIFIGNIIKIPAPALEFSRKKTAFHSLYF